MIRDVFSTDVFAPLRSEALRARLGYAAEDVVLVHHGILHPNKGIRRVLEWLVPVMRSNPHLKFLVIGDGEERAELEARVRARLPVSADGTLTYGAHASAVKGVVPG